jgi:hypothetical protein
MARMRSASRWVRSWLCRIHSTAASTARTVAASASAARQPPDAEHDLDGEPELLAAGGQDLEFGQPFRAPAGPGFCRQQCGRDGE